MCLCYVFLIPGEDLAEGGVGDPLVGEFVLGLDLDDCYEGSTGFFVYLLGEELGAVGEPSMEDVFAVVYEH